MRPELTLTPRDLTELIEAARGARPVDLLITNVRLVDVLSGVVRATDLAIHKGFIAGWGPRQAVRTLDAQGAHACPGFIDGHIHIESSLLSPEHFCRAVLPHGTTAIAADPHELANVLGIRGIRYLLDATAGLPLDFFFNLPSCVPSSPLETSGARLEADDLRGLLDHPRVLGLAEMMNFPGVIEVFPDVLDKLLMVGGDGLIDGHAPLLSGPGLDAYAAAGIGSDHECTNVDEAREKLARGLTIMLRHGSQSKDLDALLPFVNESTWPRCMFVCDDRHPDDLLHEGHLDAVVNRAMALGMDPVRALTLATLTPAAHFRLKRRGALAPGYLADFSLSPTLAPWTPTRIFKNGVEVAADGQILVNVPAPSLANVPASPMNLTPPTAEMLAAPAQPGRLKVIEILEGSLLTNQLLVEPRVQNGNAVADPTQDILKLAVFNRYVAGRAPAVGFIKGLGLKRGAVASTVAHDSHNLIVAGARDEDMLAMINALRESGGGLAMGESGGETLLLPLPIGGLMSDRPLEEVAATLDAMKALAARLGSPLHNPFMALAFVALPVIPHLKLTDLGLIDVDRFAVTPLFQ